MKKFIATKDDNGRKILSFIKKLFPDAPLSYIYKLFRKKEISINNQRIDDRKYIIKQNDLITIYGFYKPEDLSLQKFNESVQVKFKTIYEDSHILVINKPTGYSVHSEENCIDDQVLKSLHFEQESSFRPSHIGRLDKETSGLMIYAKDYSTLVQLNEKINNFDKIYAFKSNYKGKNIKVKINIYQDPQTGHLSVVDKFDKNKEYIEAETYIYEQDNRYLAKLVTGKKHQIRLTLKYLNNPIWGDKKYGGKKASRMYLHCYKIILHKLVGDLKYLNGKEFICEPRWKN